MNAQVEEKKGKKRETTNNTAADGRCREEKRDEAEGGQKVQGSVTALGSLS